jgi:hypothetical protein
MRKRRQNADERGPGPTPERLAKAGEAFTVGHHGIITIRNSPLEWMERQWQNGQIANVPEHKRRGLRPELYDTGVKYRHHWHFSGMLPKCGSVDLNRIFGGIGGNVGMPSSENQAHHRRQYRKAQEEVGLIVGSVLDNVICLEFSLVDAGRLCGWRDEETARHKAEAHVREGLEKLRKLWG